MLAACGGAASAPPASSTPAATSPAAEPSPTTAPVETPGGTAAPPAPAGADPSVVDAIDACALLSAQEVAAAFGVPVDQVKPFPGGATLSGVRTCFYRPPGMAEGQQVNLAVLAAPDISRPTDPSPAPELEGAAGTWWFDALTGDLKLEAVAPDGVRLGLAYQDAQSPTPATDAALAFLVPLMQVALERLP